MTGTPATPERLRTKAYDRYRKHLLTPDEIRAYSEVRRLPPIRDVALAWAVIIAAWAWAAHLHTWWAILLALPVIGSRYYALFIIGHDGLHRRIFRSRRANDRFADVLVFAPIWAITRVNNINHIRHHDRLATDDDPDRYKYTCLNKADLLGLIGYVTSLTSVFTSVRNVFFGSGEDTAAAAAIAVQRPTYTPADFAILLTVQAALISGLTWTFGWWGYPVMWLLPVYLFTFLMDNFRTFAEHSHPESDARGDEHRLITYLANPLERCVFAPMNMNYHAVHHLWPSIPYYQLPAADRTIRERAGAAGLEWRRSYLGYFLRYALALPLGDCRKA